MDKLIAFIGISLDGFHADTTGGLAWQTFGEEFSDFSIQQLDEVDALLFGRTTYDGMVQYWPQQAGADFDNQIADRMNGIRKYVVSHSTPTTEWHNTSVLHDLDEVPSIEGTVAVFGSSSLVVQLLRHGLLDELRLMINPVALGAGAQLLKGITLTNFTLQTTHPSQAGHVLLTYTPTKN
jgi:dihydrofolate reductase